MSDAYDELKEIMDGQYRTSQFAPVHVFINLLAKNGIKPRDKDGAPYEFTLSTALSKIGMVIGLRYKKNDGSFSEDLFLFEPGQPVTSGYRGKLEKLLPEYRGTHKRNPIIGE